MPSFMTPDQPAPTREEAPALDTLSTAPISRRGFGRRMLLGASALAIATLAGKPDQAQAAPTTPWQLGGNSILTNGTEFLGTTNVAPLIFKTTAAANPTPVERMRITPPGLVGIGITAPTARLHTRTATTTAVQGESSSTAAGANGVLGKLTATTTGLDAAGVRGVSPNGTGVKGEGYIAVHGVGGSYGVYAYGTTYALYASSTATGVYGYGPEVGVVGETGTGAGTSTGTGVKGVSNDDSLADSGVYANAVYGEGKGANNIGVRGEANTGTGATGVWGISSSGWAGYFNGKVQVTGLLSKPAGSFKIDHPLHPDTKYLYHSFVESPDMMNVYNGNVTTDAKGEATVELPSYFEALNRDFRYQLTALDAPGPNLYIAERLKGNRFKIAGGTAGMEVSWQVTGIRQDAFANANRIPVEEDKSDEERGKYLHPKAHGKPESAGVDAERIKHEQEKKVSPGRSSQAPQPVAPSTD